MGMYTELNIGVEFKRDTPKEVIDALTYMVTPEGERGQVGFPVDHALFQTERWKWMLRSGGSYYFDAQPVLVWRFDEIPKAYFLTVCTNIKNYSNEWEAFLDFIAPHLQTAGYIGTYRYEEAETPTLLYSREGKVHFVEPKEKPHA